MSKSTERCNEMPSDLSDSINDDVPVPSSRRLAQTWPFPRYYAYQRKMRETAKQWFDSKDLPRDPKYAFILDKWENWPSNLILPDVVEYIKRHKAICEGEGKPFPLHKYLHHGLSSQAMAFNLVGPLIVRHDYEPLLAALRSVGVPCEKQLEDAVFEFEDRKVFNEDSGQPTSIDIALRDASGRPFVFIESKMMEAEFGSCTVLGMGDCAGKNPLPAKTGCYLHHIGRRYWTLAEKHGLADLMKGERQCVLALNYQFFRELLFALEYGGIFVLLHDERSPVFHCDTGSDSGGIMPFVMQFVPDRLRSRVASLSMQTLAKYIADSGRHADWIGDFRQKYGL
jgi:hypothetical protein